MQNQHQVLGHQMVGYQRQGNQQPLQQYSQRQLQPQNHQHGFNQQAFHQGSPQQRIKGHGLQHSQNNHQLGSPQGGNQFCSHHNIRQNQQKAVHSNQHNMQHNMMQEQFPQQSQFVCVNTKTPKFLEVMNSGSNNFDGGASPSHGRGDSPYFLRGLSVQTPTEQNDQPVKKFQIKSQEDQVQDCCFEGEAAKIQKQLSQKNVVERVHNRHHMVYNDELDANPYCDFKPASSITQLPVFDDHSPMNQPPSSPSRERSGTNDDSRILQNVIAEIPSGREQRMNNSKAHSLDSFRTEPEPLDDPPSPNLSEAGEYGAGGVHSFLIRNEISKIEMHNQTNQKFQKSTSLISFEDEAGSNNEKDDKVAQITQLPKKSKSKRKLFAQSVRVKSLEIFCYEKQKNAIDGSDQDTPIIVHRNHAHQNEAHQSHQEKERSEDKRLLISDEHQEDSPLHSLNLPEYNKFSQPMIIVPEQQRRESTTTTANLINTANYFSKDKNQTPSALIYRAVQSNKTEMGGRDTTDSVMKGDGETVDNDTVINKKQRQSQKGGGYQQETILVSDMQSTVSPTIINNYPFELKNRLSMQDSTKLQLQEADTPLMNNEADDLDKLTFGQPFNRQSAASVSGSEATLENFQMTGSQRPIITKDSMVTSYSGKQVKNINLASSLKPVKERVKKNHSKGKKGAGTISNSTSSQQGVQHHQQHSKQLAQIVRSNMMSSFRTATMNHPRIQIDINMIKKGSGNTLNTGSAGAVVMKTSSRTKSAGKNSNGQGKKQQLQSQQSDVAKIQKNYESLRKLPTSTTSQNAATANASSGTTMHPFISVKPFGAQDKEQQPQQSFQKSFENKKSKSLSRIQKAMLVLQDHHHLKKESATGTQLKSPNNANSASQMKITAPLATSQFNSNHFNSQPKTTKARVKESKSEARANVMHNKRSIRRRSSSAKLQEKDDSFEFFDDGNQIADETESCTINHLMSNRASNVLGNHHPVKKNSDKTVQSSTICPNKNPLLSNLNKTQSQQPQKQFKQNQKPQLNLLKIESHGLPDYAQQSLSPAPQSRRRKHHDSNQDKLMLLTSQITNHQPQSPSVDVATVKSLSNKNHNHNHHITSINNALAVPLFKAEFANSVKIPRHQSDEIGHSIFSPKSPTTSNMSSSSHKFAISPFGIAIDYRKNVKNFSPKGQVPHHHNQLHHDSIMANKSINSQKIIQHGYNKPQGMIQSQNQNSRQQLQLLRQGGGLTQNTKTQHLKLEHQKSAESTTSKKITQSRKYNHGMITTQESNPSALSMANPHIWQRRETPNAPRVSLQKRQKAKMNNSDLCNTGIIHNATSSRIHYGKQKSGETLQSTKTIQTIIGGPSMSIASGGGQQQCTILSASQHKVEVASSSACNEESKAQSTTGFVSGGKRAGLPKQKSSKSLNVYRKKKPTTVTLQLDITAANSKQKRAGVQDTNDIVVSLQPPSSSNQGHHHHLSTINSSVSKLPYPQPASSKQQNSDNNGNQNSILTYHYQKAKTLTKNTHHNVIKMHGGEMYGGIKSMALSPRGDVDTTGGEQLMIQKVITQTFMSSTKIEKDKQSSQSPLKNKKTMQGLHFDYNSNQMMSKKSSEMVRPARKNDYFIASLSGDASPQHAHSKQSNDSSQNYQMSSTESLQDHHFIIDVDVERVDENSKSPTTSPRLTKKPLLQKHAARLQSSEKPREKRPREPMNQNFLQGSSMSGCGEQTSQPRGSVVVDQKKTIGRGCSSLRDYKTYHKMLHKPLQSVGTASISLQYKTNSTATVINNKQPQQQQP